MSSISSNSYLNNKRQSNARKTAAAVARHRQLAFQIHRDSSAQSSSSARPSSSKMMLYERDSKGREIPLTIGRGFPSRVHECRSTPSEDTAYH